MVLTRLSFSDGFIAVMTNEPNPMMRIGSLLPIRKFLEVAIAGGAPRIGPRVALRRLLGDEADACAIKQVSANKRHVCLTVFIALNSLARHWVRDVA